MSAKRILITGAASGIGEATMAEFHRRGVQVIGLDLVAENDDMIKCDVRDQESVDKAVAEGIERLGGLDVLINGAGIAPRRIVDRTILSSFRKKTKDRNFDQAPTVVADFAARLKDRPNSRRRD